jgi:hypothetical protein
MAHSTRLVGYRTDQGIGVGFYDMLSSGFNECMVVELCA